VRIRFLPTFSEYWQLNRFVLARKFRWFLWMCVSVFALFLISPWVVFKAYRSAGVVERYREVLPLLFAPGWLLLVYVATYVKAKKRWQTIAHLPEEKEYELEDAGLHARCQSANSNCGWNVVQSATITEQLVYLSLGQNLYWYFPVSAVPDMAQLVGLLTDKLGADKVEIVRKQETKT